ncbi:MAG: hypothetical protein ACTSSH_00015 [Candidatus Heimdallarchaeota archaeon]
MATRLDGEKDNRGGTKPGAGRPKGAISLETKRKQAFEKLFISEVNKNKKPIIEALMKKSKEGDVRALTDILNRIVGKPTEKLDLTSKGEQILVNVVNYKNDGDNNTIPVQAEKASAGVLEEQSPIQDSGVSQTGGEILNGSK